MQLSHVLNQLMAKRSLSNYKLGKETGISDRLIGYWRTGEKLPGAENLIIIANYFGISVDMLLTGKEYVPDNVAVNTKEQLTESEEELLLYFRKLSVQQKERLIGRAELLAEQSEENLQQEHPTIKLKHSYYKVSAGKGYDLDYGDSFEVIEVPDTPTSRRADMCLTIMGDSMEPVYKDGDIVLVREQVAVDPGQIGIFIVEGKGYIKKYGENRLISINDNYDDIMFADYDPDSIRCVGAVIGRV